MNAAITTDSMPSKDFLLTIITINWNNKDGLEKTMKSVINQNTREFEYVIVDGASQDGSVETIRQYADDKVIWVSEKDNGIYNAMNKGIRMAKGKYVMMLNSGDWLIDNTIVEKLLTSLRLKNYPDILYGTTINVWPDGQQVRNVENEDNYTMFSFYHGTLDHVGTCIKKNLFDQYGMYDESLHICSDWSWFMKVVAFGGVKPIHIDLDTAYFDMTGISENNGKNRQIIVNERRKVLTANLPIGVLADYDIYCDDILMIKRLHRHKWAFTIVRAVERVLFKIEKWKTHISR